MSTEKHSITTLGTLTNSTRDFKRRKRVGRGPGSKLGKTCGRGVKGAGARAGYKRRFGYEGGQMRLHMKTPKRGFSNARFCNKVEAVNLLQIEVLFNEGDVINAETLKARGLVSSKAHGVKILGEGQLKKKVKIEVTSISAGAKEKLQKANIAF